MVVLKDFRREFYDVIQAGQRVLVLVAFDVDALCAVKILQYLFQCDQILYTIVPVSGRQDLEQAFIENAEGIKNILFINCAGNIDVVELLQPLEGVVFYICDSHRPVDVHNIYNAQQVKMLVNGEELNDVPEFEELFREEDSDDDSGNDSDGSEPGEKRNRFNPDAIEKRREKRKWLENREKVLFEYNEFSSHGSSAAVTMFELAWKMSKDTGDLLWLACTGLTDQYLHLRINRESYIDKIGDLQTHVSRHNRRGDDEENVVSVDCLKVTFEDELLLCLYRHWTLYDSICHSVVPACQFKIWTMKGKKRLQEFFADMGLPLVQSKQKFFAMDPAYKNNIREMVENKGEKYGLLMREIFLPSFVAQYGYRNKFSAMDITYSAASLLESVEQSKSQSDRFLDAMDLLTRNNRERLDQGLESAKLQAKAILNQVQCFLDMNQVISAGPYLYAFITEGTPDIRFFTGPICLERLAKFTLTAYCAMSKSKKAPTLPLIIGVPLKREVATTLIIGIPPLADTDSRNVFGKAFQEAAITTSSRMLQDNFDTHIIEMRTEDRSKFFDALIQFMQL